LEEHGAVDNFRRLSGRVQASRRGPLYTDSDVYKWMEVVAFALQTEQRPELRAHFDRLTSQILAAQEPRGYLNTYYVDDQIGSPSATRKEHELLPRDRDACKCLVLHGFGKIPRLPCRAVTGEQLSVLCTSWSYERER
jgi:DUF1680 family protein